MRFYTLTRTFEETDVEEKLAWASSLVVSSLDETGYPSKVFVFQAETPGDPDTRGWFTAVASPAQLLEYPEDAPTTPEPGAAYSPFYRLDSVTLVSRNAADLQRVEQQIEDELTLLENNLEAIAVLTPWRL